MNELTLVEVSRTTRDLTGRCCNLCDGKLGNDGIEIVGRLADGSPGYVRFFYCVDCADVISTEHGAGAAANDDTYEPAARSATDDLQSALVIAAPQASSPRRHLQPVSSVS